MESSGCYHTKYNPCLTGFFLTFGMLYNLTLLLGYMLLLCDLIFSKKYGCVRSCLKGKAIYYVFMHCMHGWMHTGYQKVSVMI